MDDISPDLISRMASRIYNDAPSPNGHGTPQVAMPSAPSAPEMPAVHEQPNTGPGLWAVCVMSLAVLWGMTRKYFAHIG